MDLINSQELTRTWSGAYPMPACGILKESLCGDNVMIVGDAAGFTPPISAEGINPSILSGKIAGETAIKALESEDYSVDSLKKYKLHPTIKKLSRTFKLNRSMAGFFFENKGQNINRMFELAESDISYKEQIVDMFLFNRTPSKQFLAQIRGESSAKR
jgi:flavin-dependent dehydrogenase